MADTVFKVMSKRCKQCLMTNNKIVSDARREEILRDTSRRQTHFICHLGSMADQNIACRGHYDERGGGLAAAIARYLGITVFIDPETLQPVAKQK